MTRSGSFKNCRFIRSSWSCRTSNSTGAGRGEGGAGILRQPLRICAGGLFYPSSRWDDWTREPDWLMAAWGGSLSVGERSLWAFCC